MTEVVDEVSMLTSPLSDEDHLTVTVGCGLRVRFAEIGTDLYTGKPAMA